METMYKAKYFGLNRNGDEAFAHEKYFTSHAKALDFLREKTHQAMPFDHKQRTLLGVDLYCWIASFRLSEGVFILDRRAMFSMLTSDGNFRNYEGETSLVTSFRRPTPGQVETCLVVCV